MYESDNYIIKCINFSKKRDMCQIVLYDRVQSIICQRLLGLYFDLDFIIRHLKTVLSFHYANEYKVFHINSTLYFVTLVRTFSGCFLNRKMYAEKMRKSKIQFHRKLVDLNRMHIFLCSLIIFSSCLLGTSKSGMAHSISQ